MSEPVPDTEAVLQFLKPFFSNGSDAPETLPDGSSVVFTLKDEQGRDLVSMVLKDERLVYVTRRNVAAGETLYSERPTVCISLLERSKGHELLPADHVTVNGLYKSGGAAMTTLPASLEWMIVAILANDPERAKRTVSQMPQPGKYSISRVLMQMAQDKTALPQDVRDWVAYILRKTAGKLLIDEILLMYGSICRNALHLQTPLTDSSYAIGLYPGAANISSSCVPTARTLFGEGGMVHVIATSDWPAGTQVSIARGGTAYSPFFRCIQTAPQWVRATADSSTGVRCECPECEATVAWLRRCAGAGEHDEMSEETVSKIVAIVNDTWKAPEPDAWPYPAALEGILKFALRLPHVSEFAEFAMLVPEATIHSMCTAPAAANGPSLSSLAICHALLLAAVHHPGLVSKKYSSDAISLASEFLVHGGHFALIAMLRQQGASVALIRARGSEYLAKIKFLAFAAAGSLLIMQIPGIAGKKKMPAKNLLPETAKVMRGTRIKAAMDDAWNHAIVYCAQPGPNAKSLPKEAANATGDLIRMETSFFTLLQPIISNMYDTKDDK